MPKDKEMTNHPCHLLSLPSAKRFWCRHCMTVFEDAITRWRHSRSCRYGVVNNFMKRRELEAKALQNTTVLNPVEARVEQSIQMADLASSTRTAKVRDENGVEILTTPEDFTCFICHKKFQSMDEMRHHVKFPCNASKIVTTKVPHPKHSVPIFIESVPPRHSWDQTQTIEIQQPTSFIHEQNYQTHQHGLEQHAHAGTSVEVLMQDPGFEQSYADPSISYDAAGRPEASTASTDQEDQKNLTPTTIYVNEKGETVIEVENLDLSSDGGELSLAHLLTQLSQQGIVFDKSRSSSLQAQDFVLETRSDQGPTQVFEVGDQEHEQPTQSEIVKKEGDEEEGQPTAEDAANTLAQLAGFRGYIQKQQPDIVPDSEVKEEQGQQTVELIQLSNNGHASSTASSLIGTQSIQAYQYASPVTIQYTYPSSTSMAVVSNQVQQQDHAGTHHIVGAQHMTLQEVLTTDSTPQLYIQAEAEAEVTRQADDKHETLNSVRYVVDPVTGHQVMQQLDAEDDNQGDELDQEHYISTKQLDEGVQNNSQVTSIEQQNTSVQENTASHPLIVAAETSGTEIEMENSAVPEELSQVNVTSAEESVHMETDYNSTHPQVDSNNTDNSRPDNKSQNQTQTVSSPSASSITVLDVSSSMSDPQSVATKTICSTVETEKEETQSASNATAAMMEIASGSHEVIQHSIMPQSVPSNTHTTLSVVQCGSVHSSDGQEVQEQYQIVTCSDLEEDIPSLPVGAANINEVNPTLSNNAGLTSHPQVGENPQDNYSSGVGEDKTQLQAELQQPVTTEQGKEPNELYYQEEAAGTDNTSVVTGPHLIMETGCVEVTGHSEVAVGTDEQEFDELEENHHQHQSEMNTVFVVTPSGIQPISRQMNH